MGDRALVTFTVTDGQDAEYSPAIYLHWHGSDVPVLLRAAAPRLRAGDPSYSAARFCGYCSTEIEGHLGLGLLPAPQRAADGSIDWSEYSHGNAGVFVVNVTTGEVACHAGYGEAFTLDPATFAQGKGGRRPI